MVNSYQRGWCDSVSRLETAPSTPCPSFYRPLCAMRPLNASCFLKENDHLCQNWTISPANDVWLRTTTLLPVSYELNEPTGSQHRKLQQEERRKYVSKHALQKVEMEPPWKTDIGTFWPRPINRSTTVLLSLLSCMSTFLFFQGASMTDMWLTMERNIQWKESNLQRNDFLLQASPSEWRQVFDHRGSEGQWAPLWTCVQSSSFLRTLALITLPSDIPPFLSFSTNKESASLLRNLAQGLEIPMCWKKPCVITPALFGLVSNDVCPPCVDELICFEQIAQID